VFVESGSDFDGMIIMDKYGANYASVIGQKQILNSLPQKSIVFVIAADKEQKEKKEKKKKMAFCSLLWGTVGLEFSGPPEKLKACASNDSLSRMAGPRTQGSERYPVHDTIIQTSTTNFQIQILPLLPFGR
jgi:hypothetical protein